jgi:hypothetical protein
MSALKRSGKRIAFERLPAVGDVMPLRGDLDGEIRID